MANRFIALHDKTFTGIMDFMYALKGIGFDSEFADSLIMRAFWTAVERLKNVTGKDANVLLHAEVVDDENHGDMVHLALILEGVGVLDVQEQIKLFIKNENATVLTNVLTALAVPDTKVNYKAVSIKEGERVSYDEAHAVFTASQRFSRLTFTVFNFAFKSIKPKELTELDYVRLVTRDDGIQVIYVVAGKVVQRLTYGYNY